MAKYQLSTNLIDQVQILLRNEALPQSFNPNDLSFLPTSTLDEAIAGFDPSVDELRCEECRGVLLRGLESSICIYCGCFQRQERPRESIHFKSTLGFRWLLQSLGLDGSEIVGPPIGGNQSNRGRSSLNDETSLSDFLDLEVKWSDKSEISDVTNEAQPPGKRSLKFVGVDFDDLFPEGSREDASCVHGEQLGSSKKFESEEITTFPGQRSLSLFEKTQSSEVATRSDGGENDESFSVWEAEFQSANLDARHEQSQSFDVSSNPLIVDKTSRTNSTFGPVDQEKAADNPISHAPSGSNLTHNDQLEITTRDLSHDEKRVYDDSFDEWIFTGEGKNTCEPSSTSIPGTEGSGGLDISDGWNDFTGSSTVNNKLETNIKEVRDDDYLPTWNNFTTSSIISDPTLGGKSSSLLNGTHQDQQDISAEKSTSSQGDSNGLWSTYTISSSSQDDQLQGRGIKSPVSGTNKEVGDSFDLWTDFKRSAVEHDGPQEENIFKVAINKMSSESNVTVDLQNNDLDDSFAWNDFTRSTGVSDSKPTNNETSFGSWNGFSSSTITHGDEHIKSSTKAIENQTILEDDYSFSSWGDLKSLGTQAENSFLSPNVIESSQDQINARNLTMVKDDSPFDSWGDFGHSKPILEKPLQASGSHDIFNGWSNSGKQTTNIPDNQLNDNGEKVRDGKSTSENDDLFDAWSDFTGSSNVPESHRLKTSANDLNEQAVKNDELFDGWDVFVSSANVQAGNGTSVAKENTPEVNFFNTNTNLQGLGSNTFLHQDPFPEMLADLNGSAQVVPRVPDLGRTEDASSYSKSINPSETPSGETLEIKSSDVETLISEMHDLSFMLENSLSIPKSDS